MLSRGKENQGVPRTGSSSSSHSFMPERALHTLSSNIQVKSEHDRKGKGKEVKPTLAQLAAVSGPRGTFDSPLLISDGESEDEVFELSESQIPDEFKKKSNKDCPIVLEDDNDVPAPSRPTAPLAEIFTRPSSSQAPRSVTRPSWATATSQSTPQKQQSTAQPDVAQEFSESQVLDMRTRLTVPQPHRSTRSREPPFTTILLQLRRSSVQGKTPLLLSFSHSRGISTDYSTNRPATAWPNGRRSFLIQNQSRDGSRECLSSAHVVD